MQKTILITGCSSGIGLYAAEKLKERGYRIFATARQMVDVQKLTVKGFESVQLDVDDSISIRAALKKILQQTDGHLYALFNNAGYGQTGAVEDTTRDMLRAQFETNVFGPVELITEVLPIMLKQGYGRIIQNSSLLGMVAMPYYGIYCGSKFALDAISASLRQELRGTQIFVSVMVPGPMQSKFRENTYAIFEKTIKTRIQFSSKRYKNLEEYFSNPEDIPPPFSTSTNTMVKHLINALESKKPKAHYYIGFPSNLFSFLKRCLSDSILDWIILKIDRLKLNE